MAPLIPQSPQQHDAREEDVDNLVPSSAGSSLAAAAPSYKSAFLQACFSASVLTFGDYTLKSGRQSPYFFNAGLFDRADLLESISTAYAETLIQHRKQSPDFEFDVLFGPAYKGIPLAAVTAHKLALIDKKTYGEVRKEIKVQLHELILLQVLTPQQDHGEGGVIVGAPLQNKRVVIIDDVITAGTAMREAINIIQQQGGTLVGVIIALNRKERMSDEGPGSAIGEVQKEYGVPVLSIIDLDDLIGELGELGDERDMLRVEEYKRRYGASD
ncbi:orotate phosphoribosyltransferase [Lecanora helva]